MPKTEEGQSDKSRSKDTRLDSGRDEVQGRYPTSKERVESVERAQETKKKHERLFRRLAGKDDQ